MEVGSSGISRDLAGFHRILWALSGSRGNSGFHRATLELWNEKYLGAVGDKRLRFPLLSLKNLAFVTSQANCRVSLHPPRLRGPAKCGTALAQRFWVTPRSREVNWAFGAANLVSAADFWWGTAVAQAHVCRVQGHHNSNYYSWGQLIFPSAVRGLEFIPRDRGCCSLKSSLRALLSLIPPKAGSRGTCSLHPSPCEEMFSSFKYARKPGARWDRWVECWVFQGS